MTIEEFIQKQSLPYEAKISHASKRAWEFYETISGEYDANCHVSVGGLDSITLLLFLLAAFALGALAVLFGAGCKKK